MKTFLSIALMLVALSCFSQGKKYSEYPQATTLSDGWLFLVAQPGVTNYSITFSNLQVQIINNPAGPSVNFYIVSNFVSYQYVTNQYVTTQTVQTNNTFISYTTNLFTTNLTANTSYVTNLIVTTNTTFIAYVTNLITTNLIVNTSYTTNQYVTTNFTQVAYITNLYTTNLTANYSYLTNLYTTNLTVNNSYTTNQTVVTNNTFIAYITNLYTTNLTAGVANITNLTVENFYANNAIFTNVFTGHTNQLLGTDGDGKITSFNRTNGVALVTVMDLRTPYTYTNHTANFTITGFTSGSVDLSNTNVQWTTAFFTNNSASAKTITFPADWQDLGSKGNPVYNTNIGCLSVMRWPNGFTNYLWIGR